MQDAIIRQLSIIGEAATQLSLPFGIEHAELPWGKIIGMQHRLVHDYCGINLEIVWRTVAEDLPVFKDQIARLAASL